MIKLALLRPYGISDILIICLPLAPSSIFATPLIITDPLHVEYACKRASLS